jgi:superfamily II DNA helicase RecQ
MVRLRLAQEKGTPAFVVFHDSTLMEMAQARPANGSELLAPKGVGRRMVDEYGEVFLAEIALDEPSGRPGKSGKGSWRDAMNELRRRLNP